MPSKSRTALLAGALVLPLASIAEEAATMPESVRAEHARPEFAQKMRWFKDAKFGIFIHYGIYSVKGIGESWSFFNGDISYPDYMKQLEGFTAAKYDPDAWAKLFAESGARYAVMTSRHHDGVALWASGQGINVAKNSPAQRDLVGPYVDALRKQHLKVGLYYSILDWSHPDYDVHTRTQKRYDAKQDGARLQRFVKYYQGQLKELSERYNPDLFWFDGDWEHSAEELGASETRKQLLSTNPNVIVNSRLGGYGDYATPEQGLPVNKPMDAYWELCLTMNQSWGYQPLDKTYKTANELIGILARTISMGGNLLLDIGPRADGTIDPPQVDILKKMGRWTRKHAQAIYGTEAGIPTNYFAGPSTLSPDRKTLYLFLEGRPNEKVLVLGLQNDVLRATVVGNGAEVAHRVVGRHEWAKYPGMLYLKVPDSALDKDITVLALELDKPVSLYTGAPKPIETN